MAADSIPTNDPDAATWHREAANPHSDLSHAAPTSDPTPTLDEAAERAALVAASDAADAAYDAADIARTKALGVKKEALHALDSFEWTVDARSLENSPP